MFSSLKSSLGSRWQVALAREAVFGYFSPFAVALHLPRRVQGSGNLGVDDRGERGYIAVEGSSASNWDVI